VRRPFRLVRFEIRSVRLWLFPVFFAAVVAITGRGIAAFSIMTAPLVFQDIIPKSGLKRFPRIFNVVPALVFFSWVISFTKFSGHPAFCYDILFLFGGHFHLYWFDCLFALSLALCRRFHDSQAFSDQGAGAGSFLFVLRNAIG